MMGSLVVEKNPRMVQKNLEILEAYALSQNLPFALDYKTPAALKARTPHPKQRNR